MITHLKKQYLKIVVTVTSDTTILSCQVIGVMLVDENYSEYLF